MSSPTVKEATDDQVDATNVKYGAPDVVHIVKLIKGTHGTEKIQVAAINNAVSLAGTETLTNKTIAASNNTLTGVVTPTSTDTLTNKTMDAKNNTFPNVFTLPNAGTLYGGWFGADIANASVSGIAGTVNVLPTGQTITAKNDIDGKYMELGTAGTSGSQAGWRTTTGRGQVARISDGGLICKFRLNNATGATPNFRFFCGLTSITGTWVTGDTWLDNNSGIGLFVRGGDSGTSNFFVAHNSGTASTTFTDTGIAKDSTTVFTFEIQAVADTRFDWRINNGSWNQITTNIPASTQGIGTSISLETTEAVAKSFGVWWWIVKAKG